MSNPFVNYILNRIQKDNYRGYHLSQHNRLPFDKVSAILKKIYALAGDKKFNIHVGDDKGKRQKNCQLYYQIVEELNKEIGQVTINSLKKNIFPDFDTMGFLYRFDDKGNLTHREKRSKIYSAQLTQTGIQYAIEQNPKEQYKMYIHATEKILQPIINDLFYLLYKEFDSISAWEFMFVFSDEDISLKEKITLIKESRKLSKLQHIQFRAEIEKQFSIINENAADKKEKRDFGNWYNETLQILNLLNQTIYFKTFRKTVLMLALSQDALEFRVTRSQNEKIKCLQWHQISMKQQDYELHHIYPLDYASSTKDLDLIDDYRNLIYISKKLHREIPVKNNLWVKLDYQFGKLMLVNPFDSNEYLDITQDVIVNPLNLDEMMAYNQKILQSTTL